MALNDLKAAEAGRVTRDMSATMNRPANDVVSMLIGIYGSKELFVDEYRSLLSGERHKP